ncbi:putative replication initiation protein [Otevirus soksuewis]|uniref:Putative replication initiation protein n=1 Tax=Palaemonetes sp. common grass shrimp associated circular virus TaxID=1692259 RepID=A0A0K1RL59_9CIRC|nr:putative replication initiation protein [Palaemonetes sp. common grass shrimp associated circular virus]AKV62300.1 putative replication initiation protein [Palaemonetes sp. common grass shrimp associated circular virus]
MAAKRDSAVKRWCFTLNNYTDADCEALKEKLTTDTCSRAIVGKEKGENGTPHLQGFVSLKTRKRLSAMKTFLSPRYHFEQAKGTDEQNTEYCSKEGDVLIDVGENVKGRGDKGGGFNEGANIKRVVYHLLEGKDKEALLQDEKMLGAYMKYKRSITEMVSEVKSEQETKRLKQDLDNATLRPWQRELKEYLTGDPHDRHIIWYIDGQGNNGKSWFAKYCVAELGAIRLENAKTADLTHAYNGERVVIFDLSRTTEGHFNYGALESIKNGCVFSSKYDSRQKMFPIPHVIVFANWGPDRSKLSEDRWVTKTWSFEQETFQTF